MKRKVIDNHPIEVKLVRLQLSPWGNVILDKTPMYRRKRYTPKVRIVKD